MSRARKPSPSRATLRGANYVATRRLTDKSGRTVFATVGETCERVPEQSLGWLADRGLIVPARRVEEA